MVKAPLIFKIKFTLPDKRSKNGTRNAAHVKYIATRPGVEKEMLKEEDLVKDLDTGFLKDENYTKYVHERPGSHGLFGPDQKQPDLFNVQKELQDHKGIVWRAVISMREDDASYLGYIEKEKWEQSLRSRMAEISQEMGISESNLRWVAAFHQAKGHPHSHVVFWEKEPQRSKGVLSPVERKSIRRIFTVELYREERERLGRSKMKIRKHVLEMSRGDLDVAAELTKELKGNLEEIKLLDRRAGGIAPTLYEGQTKELALKLYNLTKIMPGKGRKSLAFMPDEVKKEVREIADWILDQPGFKLEAKQFMETAESFNRQYTKNEAQINESGKEAYKDLRDRVSQEIVRQAGEIQKKIQNKVIKIEKSLEANCDLEINYSQEEPYKSGAFTTGATNHKPSKLDDILESLYKRSFRLLEKNIYDRHGEFKRIDFKFYDAQKYFQNEIADELENLAVKIADIEGKPVLNYFSQEIQDLTFQITNKLLKYDNLQILNNMYSKYADSDEFKQVIAEEVISHAYDLVPKGMPKIIMVLDTKRATEAISKIDNANVFFINDDQEETEWTIGTLYRTCLKLGLDEEQAKDKAQLFGERNGFENINEVLEKEKEKLKKLEERLAKIQKEVPNNISRKDWTRLRENLGFREKELLFPWFGAVQPENNISQVTEKEEIQFGIIQENVNAFVNTVKDNASNLDIEYSEVLWTIKTLNVSLKFFGIETVKRENLIKNWCSKSHLKIPEARIKDLIDRSELFPKNSFCLGKEKWGRFINNLGIDQLESPWKFQGKTNFINQVWKSAWQIVKREQIKQEMESLISKRKLQQKLDRVATFEKQ